MVILSVPASLVRLSWFMARQASQGFTTESAENRGGTPRKDAMALRAKRNRPTLSERFRLVTQSSLGDSSRIGQFKGEGDGASGLLRADPWLAVRSMVKTCFAHHTPTNLSIPLLSGSGR